MPEAGCTKPAAVVVNALIPCGPCAPCAPRRGSVATQAAPTPALSSGPPIRAVVASADSATLHPKEPAPVSPSPVRFEPCGVQTLAERINIQAAPREPLLSGPPIRAVFPSAANATLSPKWPLSISSVAVSFGPCCVPTPPERVNTQAAPSPAGSLWPSVGPPIRAVVPLADSATLVPNWLEPTVSSLAISLSPGCVQEPSSARVSTQAAPA